MAGAASWKGAIKIGAFVQFPVRARSAVKELRFGFNMHHREDGGRLSMGDMVCQSCGELIARGSDQIIKGFEGYVGEPNKDGSFNGVDMTYIESLEQERSAIVEVESMVLASEIDPRYFQKSYDLVPDKGGEKAYVLLAKVLDQTGRIGVGKLVMSGKEFIVVVRPRGTKLAMEALYWPEEVKSDADAQAAIEGVEISAKELQMGEQLVKHMSGRFQPETLVNQWSNDMATYLEQFKAGQTPVAVPVTRQAAPAATSLEDALAASLAALDDAPKAKRSKKAA